jgi:soluble lytic murein transglycosylase-like protein
MIRFHAAILGLALTALAQPASAELDARSRYDAMVATHARANGVPESLVHRVIVRESRYNPRLIGKGGAMGMMQIKTPTARGVGYTGSSAGLLDPEINLTYAVRYLAGAYRLAGGNHDRAVSYYAKGYYYAAKNKGGIEALARQPGAFSNASFVTPDAEDARRDREED